MITAKFKCDFCGFEEEAIIQGETAQLHGDVRQQSKNTFYFLMCMILPRLHKQGKNYEDSKWEINTQFGDMCPNCSKMIPEEIYLAQRKKLEELKQGGAK